MTKREVFAAVRKALDEQLRGEDGVKVGPVELELHAGSWGAALKLYLRGGGRRVCRLVGHNPSGSRVKLGAPYEESTIWTCERCGAETVPTTYHMPPARSDVWKEAV